MNYLPDMHEEMDEVFNTKVGRSGDYAVPCLRGSALAEDGKEPLRALRPGNALTHRP